MAGTVRFRVPDSLLKEAGFEKGNVSAFSRKIDVSWPTANDLLNGGISQIKMETLGKLCDTFSRLIGRTVRPSEFLEYTPDPGNSVR